MEQTEYTQHLDSVSDLIDDKDEDTQKDKYLLFKIDNETYGIDIKHITEIIVMQEITRVPDMPDSIIGVINLRGKVISVMDLRKRFFLEVREYDDRTCTIVVDINDISIGLIVDTVNEVNDIPETQIDPPPKAHSGIKNNYIKGMGKEGNQVKILLDVEKILYTHEMEFLEQAS